ncbi:nitrate reductase maturation protein NarM [Paraburkholderia sp. Ac-20336]|uniref:nitrate reductase associated protein n=1 Tax=unclassified Paraburkholderia TaxID=2615204 RepID=UPI00197FCB26|nr:MULTISPECIES: nitrate reductase associated protein [unclassified Paraburkholderia]MBN3805642.1 nitrate reductase maturation protein NarM [Paraburkholderia sp. Ac-20336]MBN3850360.1 nitrate reductase maturation protein NarM [Paraburkholderia sp. Ac-20342]
MALNEAPLLFDFEVASSENFTYIPMSVRFNLDRFGLRISLDQWQQLPLEDRKLLARFPVDEDIETEPNFDHALFEMLRTHANVEPEWFTPEAAPAWRRIDDVPAGVAHQAGLAGLAAPSVARWAELDPFKRYVLAKLSRKPEANHDFVPAMKEFGAAG